VQKLCFHRDKLEGEQGETSRATFLGDLHRGKQSVKYEWHRRDVKDEIPETQLTQFQTPEIPDAQLVHDFCRFLENEPVKAAFGRSNRV